MKKALIGDTERASMGPEPKSRMQVMPPGSSAFPSRLQWGLNRSPGCRPAATSPPSHVRSLQWGLNRSPGCRNAPVDYIRELTEASMGPEPKSRMQGDHDLWDREKNARLQWGLNRSPGCRPGVWS